MTIKLTERTYLGPGYYHWFKNKKTGEVLTVECTQEEYERMGRPGGAQYNPILPGHTWMASGGGTVKVDTPSGFLGVNEFTKIGEKVCVNITDGVNSKSFIGDKSIVDAQANIDEKLWLPQQ